MIKSFKIFERASIARTLVDKLDDDFIEEYYEENWDVDIDTILEVDPSLIEDHIDDRRFVDDFIHDEVNSRSLEDFSEYEYKKFIEKNWSDVKEKYILQKYKEDNDIDEDEELEYGDYMLDNLGDDELRDVIKEDDEEEDFVQDTINDWYEGRDAMDIIGDIYGKVEGKELYNIVRNYIDETEIIKAYKEGEDFYYKKECVEGQIAYDSKIQNYLLKKDKDNVLLLVDLFIDESGDNNIGDEYDFQNIYIEKYVENNIDEDSTDDDKADLRAESLKFLNDNFGLDSDIAREYDDDMWMVTSDKYNL